MVLVGLVVDDLQDLDEPERRSQPPEGRVLVGIDLAHATDRLVPRRVVASSAEMQVDAAALPLDLVELTLAVVLAGGLERQHLAVSGEALQLG